jgi:hypothetical protein
MLREKMSVGVLLLLAGGLVQAAEPLLVPTPRASVLAASATNRPFLAAARAQQPVDLAARDYTETELLLRGYANVYDWTGTDSELAVRQANQPFATRLLVRRPRDGAKFSGRVIVELLNPSGQYDFAPLWGFSFEHFLRRGDVWVGVTIKPVAAATLQKFDPVRYGALSFSFRQAEGCTEPGDTENGLAWDAIAQAGALLRSSSKENPLLDLNPQRVIAAGYSQSGGYVTTFANALHGRLRLGNGAPIFDGYLNAAGSMIATPINQCATALPEGDARRAAMQRDVPFVTVMTESDFNRAPALRRDDSDAARDVFRLYEIAGAAHSGPFAAGTPTPADLAIVGLDLPAANLCREPRSDFPVGYAFNAIWQQFDELLVQKLPMVSLPRIETDAAAAPKVDASGNALGGWRLPQLDVPVARYTGRSTPAADSDRARRVCEVTGAVQRFDAARLKALYRDRAEYLKRFNAAVDQAVLARRLVKEDADALKISTARVLPAF